MPFISPTPASEQSPLRLTKYMQYCGLCDIKPSTMAKYIDDGFTVNFGTDATIKTHRRQPTLLPDHPYTTEYSNQPLDDINNEGDYILSSDEIYNTLGSTEAKCHEIVRKKSGEIVKSSLKSGRFRERARSFPSTPACSKEVRFDAQLERVRHFFHSERPVAINKKDSHSDEDPFADSPCFADSAEKLYIEHSPFSSSSECPVYTEAIYLSSEGTTLVGQILVKNIAYHKSVAVRFTFDDWHTISETKAFYEIRLNDETNPKDHRYDRFTFGIELQDFTNVFSTSQCMDFCVRYNVANQEFWDNNSGINYRVRFFKCPDEPERLRRTKSCPPNLNTETCPPTLHSFFDLFNEHLDTMAEFDDTELWAASFRRHALRGPVCKNLE
jgi:hypothetical protein